MGWFVEEGIGEERAIFVQAERIYAAQIEWPGGLRAGEVAEAKLIRRAAGSSRGVAQFASGEEALIDGLPRSSSEGAPIRAEITRAAIGESGRRKRALCRPSDAPLRPAPTLAERLRTENRTVTEIRRFPVEGWDELIGEAMAQRIEFPRGALLLSPTPAMTTIDVDGELDPRALALAAVPVVGETLRRLDIGGSVGIDFPGLGAKEDRKLVDNALDVALAGWPHERTAMNGFGFVQLVARLKRPSILHRATLDPAGMSARLLLRQGEMLEGPGALLLTCHPDVEAKLRPEWLTELARRTGREVRIESTPALAIEAGQAQLVPL